MIIILLNINILFNILKVLHKQENKRIYGKRVYLKKGCLLKIRDLIKKGKKKKEKNTT